MIGGSSKNGRSCGSWADEMENIHCSVGSHSLGDKDKLVVPAMDLEAKVRVGHAVMEDDKMHMIRSKVGAVNRFIDTSCVMESSEAPLLLLKKGSKKISWVDELEKVAVKTSTAEFGQEVKPPMVDSSLSDRNGDDMVVSRDGLSMATMKDDVRERVELVVLENPKAPLLLKNVERRMIPSVEELEVRSISAEDAVEDGSAAHSPSSAAKEEEHMNRLKLELIYYKSKLAALEQKESAMERTGKTHTQLGEKTRRPSSCCRKGGPVVSSPSGGGGLELHQPALATLPEVEGVIVTALGTELAVPSFSPLNSELVAQVSPSFPIYGNSAAPFSAAVRRVQPL